MNTQSILTLPAEVAILKTLSRSKKSIETEQTAQWHERHNLIFNKMLGIILFCLNTVHFAQTGRYISGFAHKTTQKNNNASI